ncbi:MAG: MFS transporter, partial [Acidobacteria bacterium]|nr:MFS transporter [Acidobacteriota bacterium]
VQPLRRWRYRIFAVTWLAYAGFYLCRKNFSVLMPLLETDLGYSKIQFANVIFGYSLLYALGQFVAGPLADRYGPRLIVGLGFLIVIGSNLAMAFGASLALFAVLSCLNGAGQATGWSGLVKNMAWWFPHEQRGVVMAWWSTNYVLGGFLATVFATFVAAQGWRWGFLGAGAAARPDRPWLRVARPRQAFRRRFPRPRGSRAGPARRRPPQPRRVDPGRHLLLFQDDPLRLPILAAPLYDGPSPLRRRRSRLHLVAVRAGRILRRRHRRLCLRQTNAVPPVSRGSDHAVGLGGRLPAASGPRPHRPPGKRHRHLPDRHPDLRPGHADPGRGRPGRRRSERRRHRRRLHQRRRLPGTAFLPVSGSLGGAEARMG